VDEKNCPEALCELHGFGKQPPRWFELDEGMLNSLGNYWADMHGAKSPPKRSKALSNQIKKNSCCLPNQTRIHSPSSVMEVMNEVTSKFQKTIVIL
jgi:hypothetical protein